MSDEVQYKITLDLTAKSESLFTDLCVAHLRERGFNVTEPNEQWETLGAFMRRVGLRRNESFHESLRAWEERGHNIFRRNGKSSNRIIELLSNPAFDAFCRRYKK